MLMETFLMENGKMIKQMEEEFINTLMEPHMKENGRTIYSMDMALKLVYLKY